MLQGRLLTHDQSRNSDRSNARANVRMSSRSVRPDVDVSDRNSRLSRSRAAARKRSARRKFDRSGYGDRGDAPSSTRAALHTGSLGSRQRRASRSYAQSSPYQGAAGGMGDRFIGGVSSALRSLFSLDHSARFYITLGTLAMLLVVALMVYPPLKDYYTAIRDQAKSEAEYAALQDRYEQLQQDVAALDTDQGVQNLAHERYGWVSQGENSVIVQDGDSSADADASDVGIVPSGSIKAPDTWYSGVLDPFFGYEN